jgi:murein DD-endopeptidase MepM/ murein hydrolase activator NlpD
MHVRRLELALLLVLLSTAAHAQPHGFGGGPTPAPPGTCIPPEVAAAVRVAAEGQRAIRPGPITAVQQYADPMGDGGINSFGKAVTNYVDLGAGASILDWNCLANTYDGHLGTDIEIPSFYHMDEGIPILAAAPGHVTFAHDGEFDRRTEWQTGAVANAVVVAHADGSFAYYWHMRKGSVKVIQGQDVNTGDMLGYVGSSGVSSGPHLHFETYQDATIDPFSGPCRSGPSYWASQSPHVSTLPFQLFGHGATGLQIDWPTILEWPPNTTHVMRGGTVYSWIRVRNISVNDLMTWRLLRSGVQQGIVSFNPSGSYSSSWWYAWWTLQPTALDGSWSIEIQRNGVVIATEPFTVNGVPNALPVVSRTAHVIPINGRLEAAITSSDPDGAISAHEVTTPPRHGTVELYAGYQKKFRYTPNPGFTGIDGFFVRARDDQGAWGVPQWIPIGVGNITGVDDAAGGALALAVSPNPIAASGGVDFTLPRAGSATLELFDVAGHRVKTVAVGGFAAGPHRVALDASHDGRRLAAGIYFLALTTAESRLTRRVVVTP